MKKYLPLILIFGLMLWGIFGTDIFNKDSEPINEVEALKTGDATLDSLNQLVLENPDNPGLYFLRAKKYHELEGYDQAISDLRQAISRDSNNTSYFHLLADVYLDNYNSRMAINTMHNAVQRFPERIPTLLKLSEFQLILKQYEESMKTADEVLKIDPQEAEGYMMLGMNFRELGDTARAINSFQSATEINADLIDAWILLGNLFAEKGNPIAERYF
ncbi:MAG: tetratricopeptide repeat protein, partial [Saprospiraceae bacterium]|nr:tetratricopeptide repeat protein [Saprospiraceae bacterium]